MRCRLWMGALPWILTGALAAGAAPPAPRYRVESRQAVPYAEVEGARLTLDLYRPADAPAPTPVVIAIHGGGWVSGDPSQLRPLAQLLAAGGYAVVAPCYRLAPRFTFPAPWEDMRAALRWIAAHAEHYHFDTARLYALGASAGGQLAALLGVAPEPEAPRLAGVIDLCGPMDLTVEAPSARAAAVVRAYIGASQAERPEQYRQASPILAVTADDPPFLILHGTSDDDVPYEQSERMRKALQAVGVPATLVPLRGMGHLLPRIDSPFGEEIVQQVLDFLRAPPARAPAPA